MKILICTRDINTGGAGRHILSLLKEYDKIPQIKKVTVISPSYVGGYSKKIRFVKINLYGKYFITKELIFALRCNSIIEKTLRNEKYDVIHTHHPFIFIKDNTKRVATFHGLHKSFASHERGGIISVIGKLFHNIYSYFDFVTIKNSDAIIFVSQKTLNVASDYYPEYKSKFVWVPNFIDTSKFTKDDNKKEILNKYKLPEDRKIVLYVGRLDHLKGIKNLILTHKKLDKKKIELVIVGDGPLRKDVEKSGVTYLGLIPNEDLSKIYSVSDLFVLPSLYENCPTTVLEAMSCGCLCLVSDVGDNSLIINDPDQTFEPDDLSSLSRKMLILLSLNKKKSEEKRRNNIKRVNELFNTPDIAKKIIEIYDENETKQ